MGRREGYKLKVKATDNCSYVGVQQTNGQLASRPDVDHVPLGSGTADHSRDGHKARAILRTVATI